MKRALLLLLMYCGKANAVEELDVFKMFEHFALTNAAASKCIEPDKSELTLFLSNYQMVAVYALQEIQKRQPETSVDEAKEIVERVSAKATELVHSVIGKEGCESPKIQDLIKRFHVQANWKPLG